MKTLASLPFRACPHSRSVLLACAALLILAGCAAPPATVPTTGPPPSTATTAPTPAVPPTAPPPSTPTTAPTATLPAANEASAAFPLSKPGPYCVGWRTYDLVDAARDRPVRITVWYPAVVPAGCRSVLSNKGAAPDRQQAPYTLLLSSTKMADTFAPYLVSHGFTWASIDRIDTEPWNHEVVDQPRDILFALDQMAANPPAGLEGVIDAERAGLTGYSFDARNTIFLSGARVDPQHFLAECAKPPDPGRATPPEECPLAASWDEFAAGAGAALTESEDGLWQPLTSPRIRAVMPMEANGTDLLYSPAGLASIDRPMLIISATAAASYLPQNAYLLKHAGTRDKAMIAFVGQDHFMVYNRAQVERMAHFAVAFFGYYLQGRQDYKPYFSEDFVWQFKDLAWGEYRGE